MISENTVDLRVCDTGPVPPERGQSEGWKKALVLMLQLDHWSCMEVPAI